MIILSNNDISCTVMPRDQSEHSHKHTPHSRNELLATLSEILNK